MTNYPQTNTNPSFPAIEAGVAKFWAENKIFEKSVNNLPSKKEGGEEFSFFDGPPFANGLPHYGHLLTSGVKDIYARFQTMKGKRTERVFGWDCHGLPAEMEVEKELGIQGQLAIQDFGIEKFNTACRNSVMKYTNEWEHYVSSLGRWVDFENGYKTMDRNYMESVIWAFSELHKKGLVYEGHKVMPYSWACETPLSNFETRMDNAYREKVSKAITVAFELEEVPALIKNEYNRLQNLSNSGTKINPDLSDFNGIKILAWTTTPWTLPSNLALAFGKDISYKVIYKNSYLYIASANYIRSKKQELENDGYIVEFNVGINSDGTPIPEPFGFEITFDTTYGHILKGLHYKPLLPYFAGDEYVKQRGENAFTILEGDFVTDDDGTGIVHLAPGFGEDDQRVCQQNGICKPENGGIICPVDVQGKFTKEILDIPNLKIQHLNVIADTNKSEDEPYKEDQLKKYGLANLRITQYLKETGQLIKQEDYVHNYPHCWRTDTPLIYKAVPSFYVKVTAFKDRMVELNQQINWIPEHIKDGQFGKWLENAHDWAISRNRFWGAPIPIWKTPSGKTKVFGSIRELEDFFGVEVTDLHRPFIDTLTKKDEETGEIYKRVTDVLDCWFESGSMPFAELHYPFENQDKFANRFPADFIVEYSAQTRGWFYTLMVLSTALFDSIPFKNCICHGVILGEPTKNPNTGKLEKQKLSKRLKNYPDPLEVFKNYGADAMRFMMINSPVMNGGELTIAKNGDDIKEVVRLVLKPIWNAYHFFCLYANSDGVKAEEDFSSENLMDRYILAKLKNCVDSIDNSLENYNTQTACQALQDFFEVLNNWYIRRSRETFWETKKSLSKQGAYNTLYTCLVTITKAAAPLLPFLCEEIFKGLTGKESVHLERFPEVSLPEQDFIVEILVQKMDTARAICNAALSIRNKENIRTRQPLSKLTVFYKNDEFLISDFKDIIQEELNVKNVEFSHEVDSVAELKLKINFPILGKRLPDKVKEIIPASKQGKWEQIEGGKIKIAGEILEKEECQLLLEPKNPKGAAALSTNDALVILDLELTPELIDEGIARDVVRAIQQARKEADLNIADKINVSLKLPEGVVSSVEKNKNYIAEQTLSKNISFDGKKYPRFAKNYEFDESEIEISFEVAV